MKKTAKALLIVFVIFNLIFSLSGINNVKAFSSEGDFNKFDKDGTVNATVGGSEKSVSTTPTKSVLATVLGIGTEILILIPGFANMIMTAIVKDENTAGETEKFTIGSLITGQYEFFDVNFLDESNPEDLEINSNMKTNIAKYYYMMRNIALVISVFMLIYIGIRMAISTLSERKAKYQRMLMGWAVSIILIFIMHYTIIIALELAEIILNIITQFSETLNLDLSFENNIINKIETDYSGTIGFSAIPSVILYWAVVYYQLKFFMLYVMRKLEIFILIVVGPLITVTYSIDAVKDGRSQAFKTWFKELVVKIFIQDLHCLVYFIFIATASVIAEQTPLLAILFFTSLSRIEKIIKDVFKLKEHGIRDMKIPFLNK